MTVTLPQTTRARPLVRVLYRTYDGDKWSKWLPLRMAQNYGAPRANNGFLIDSWSRYALPMIGEATLRYLTGIINAKTFPSTDAPDLRHAEIRIQVAPPPAFAASVDVNGIGFTPAWRTRWWGTVEQQIENPANGEVVYHCFDGLFRSKRWQINHHSLYIQQTATSLAHVRGHPGYNVSIDGYFARILGNKEATGLVFNPMADLPATSAAGNRYYGHTWPSGIAGADVSSAKWKDREVIEHVLQSCRGKGDPVFTVTGQTHLLDGSSGWPIVEGQRAWDMVARVADRRRGRGLLFVDWANDTSDPTGDLTTYLTVRPQFKADLVYTPPGGSPITLDGATTAGTTKALDLVGDQRLVEGSLTFGDRMQYLMDYVENNGEPIEVLITPDYASSSLAKRWTDGDATAFLAVAQPRRRATSRWDTVYQRHGLDPFWDCKVADGKGATPTRCDYQCKDDGTLWDLSATGAPSASSPLVVHMSNDLPLYEGYDYTTTSPVRYDGAVETIAPPRRPVMGFGKNIVGTDLYLDLMRAGFQIQMDRQYGIFLKYGPDQDPTFAGRFFSASGVTGFAFTYQSVMFTIGVSFGNRVRKATGRNVLAANGSPIPDGTGVAGAYKKYDATSQYRLYVHHPGLSLWLAHPGAVWEFDRASAATASAPGLRAAAGGSGATPGIIRDDRATLAQLHALTCVWYLEEHRTISWAMEDCGDLPSFTNDDGSAVTYHQLGDLVTTVAYTDRSRTNQSLTCDTPVTGTIWNNISGQYSWITDWSDLDFVSR